VEGLQNEALDQYLKGFLTALAQVQTFYPKVDLSNYDPFKKIVDGQLEGPDVDSLTKPRSLLSLTNLPLTFSIAF